MDRVQRKELKHDKFVEDVGLTLEYAAEHRRQLTRYGSVAVGVILLAAIVWFYRNYQHDARQTALTQALRVQDAQVGPAADPNGVFTTFRTADEKNKAVEKAWKDLIAKYNGSDEAQIAKFYLGTFYADRGNTADAEKYFKDAADGSNKVYDSQARLSLAEVYHATNRDADAERILRDLMEHPTMFVSKEQAQVALARVLAPTKPDEARKLLEPLRTAAGAVSRVALTALSELPPVTR